MTTKFKDRVMAVLSTEGMTYPDLQQAIAGNPPRSQIGAALLALEADGKAARSKINHPITHSKRQEDKRIGPKIVWRRVG